MDVTGKTSDLCTCTYKDQERNDYVPLNIGLGDNEDYIRFNFCLECGRIQDKFPISDAQIKKALDK
jgi:hypothetical protein